MKFNQPLLKISLIFLIALSLGWLGCMILGRNIECKVAYISKEEILNLEKIRVAKESEINLFKGQAALSAELINKIGRSFESKYLKVIFASEKLVGENIFSLSKKVHEETIKHLNRLKEARSTDQ